MHLCRNTEHRGDEAAPREAVAETPEKRVRKMSAQKVIDEKVFQVYHPDCCGVLTPV